MNTRTKAKKVEVQDFESARVAGHEAVNRFIDLTTQVMTAGYKNVETMAAGQMDQAREMQNRGRNAAMEQVKVFEAVSEALAAGTEAYWKEVAAFAKSCSERNLDTARRLSESADGADWAAIQSEAMADAATQLAQHTMSLTQLATDTSAKAYEPVKKFAESNVEKVKSAAV